MPKHIGDSEPDYPSRTVESKYLRLILCLKFVIEMELPSTLQGKKQNYFPTQIKTFVLIPSTTGLLWIELLASNPPEVLLQTIFLRCAFKLINSAHIRELSIPTGKFMVLPMRIRISTHK